MAADTGATAAAKGRAATLLTALRTRLRSAMRTQGGRLRRRARRLQPRSLFVRALLIIGGPLILLQIVSAWIFYDRHWETITRRLASSLAGDIAYVMEQMHQRPDDTVRIFRDAHAKMDLAMSFRPGMILPNSERAEDGLLDRLLFRGLDERVRRPARIDSSAFKERVVIEIQLPTGVLHVVAPGGRVFSSTTYIFILWMIGASLVLFAVASVFMRNQVRPIRRLARAVDRFGKGQDPQQDFREEGAGEVRLAAAAFNRMAARIRRQMRQRTDMLSGVSHDLRTPLTRMKLQLAMLEDNPETAELKANVQEMERMIEGYLTFARGEGAEPARETDISALVGEAAGKWRDGGTNLHCHTEGRIIGQVKPVALRRCLDNLIANAARHADHVWVQAGRRGESIEILVDDDGPGIPQAERTKVLRPFYRVDRSRNPSTGGAGLGLSISLDVVHIHGGALSLEDSPHGGLRCRVSLPV